MKKLSIILFCIIALTITTLSSQSLFSNAEEKIENPSSISEITVVLDNNYPPYIFMDSNGKPQGILVDEWKLWEEKTGIKVTLFPMAWDKAINVMKAGNYDVIDTIFENPERDKFYDFTKPYAKIDVAIFFPKGISGIESAETLKGFDVAVKSEDAAISFLKSRGVFNLNLHDSYEDIIVSAKSGQDSIFVMDMPPAEYFLLKNNIQNEFKFSKPLYTGEFRRAVAKGNIGLLQTVENGFSMISKNEYKEISTKWLGSNTQNNVYSTYAMYGMLILTIIVLLLIGISYMLNKSVNNKTKELKEVINFLKQSREEEVRQTGLILSLIDTIPDIIFYKNLEGVYTGCNSLFSEIIGVPKDNIIGKTDYELFDDKRAKEYITEDSNVLKDKLVRHEESTLLPDGRKIYIETIKTPYLDADGKQIGIIGVGRDISERKSEEKKIMFMGYHDQLTGLYNRRFYEEELIRLDVKRNLPLTVAIGDVNGLKLINDSFGHIAGDDLLKSVAESIKSICRADDIIARFGGDEFVIILPKTEPAEAEKLIDRIKDQLSGRDVNGINISISFGIGTKLSSDENLLEIIKNSEDEMYRQKLYESASQRSKTIDLIMNTLYEKNYREMLHSKRVSKICQELATWMEMDSNMINQVRLAGLVHDIGKIGIDERILNSTQKLTNEEWKEIQRHCETGYRILSSVNEFSEIAEYVLQHQEKWDGTGYPRGLRGEGISKQARIISIADAFDAMTSFRTYGKELTEEEAIAEISRCSGTQFDPDIARIFVKNIRKA